MKTFCRGVVKAKWVIFIACLVLLVPSVIGYMGTKVNYDLITYLPSDIDTMKGEDILTDDFNMGGFSVVITEDMNTRQILALEDEIRDIDGVAKVGSVYDILGYALPIEILPDDIESKVKVDESNLMIVTFSNSTSDDITLEAVEKMRNLKYDIKVSGMSATTLDTAQIAESEVLIYVAIAVALCLIVLQLVLDNFLAPVLLLLNIGVAILFNMGTNIFLGQISYITKAIAAVLQLGVTTDFSIFLYHKFQAARESGEYESKEEAMAEAIEETMISVVGSSLTTIAGFLALCTMTLTLGTDIGLVMAKGVCFGVLCVLTLFPALILIFDKPISKLAHKPLLPQFTFAKGFIMKHWKIILAVFAIGMVPAYWGQAHTENYYNLTAGLPSYLPGVEANTELKDKFGIVQAYALIVDGNLSSRELTDMTDQLSEVKGVDAVLSGSKLTEMGISEDMLSDDIESMMNCGDYQLVLISSSYDVATDELNSQISQVKRIARKTDENAIVAGEGPLMKDMVNIADTDFKNVNIASIAIVFLLMVIVLRSISLPILLVIAIEFAIFINMGIPYYMGSQIPFVCSIVIGTIQLGATIDYAILMSTKYLEKRQAGWSAKDAVGEAVDTSVNSIFVSAMCFFAATIGVGLYSDIDMISQICLMIGRGALISMVTVILVVPSLLYAFDKVIIHSTLGFKDLNLKNKMKKLRTKEAH